MEVDFGKKLGTHGVEQTEPYEGAVAQLWQLLMAAQLPVVSFFGFRWLRLAPWQAASVLVDQGLALAAAAVIPVFVFGR